MNDPVPREPGIVDDDVDLSVPKLGRLLHQVFNIVGIQDISDDGNRAAGFGVVDGLDDGVCFLCRKKT